MTAHEILIAAKALIPDEEHWWRGDENPRGEACYCPLTAIAAATGKGNFEEYRSAAEAFLKGTRVDCWISLWNGQTDRTLADVHVAFDRAIEATAQ